ncbi:MAG: hypothetical protein GY922_06760, partial [Proteobacteria bacterium]|nr:hypothetical protein [Pseudomonadota bacterium]
MLITSANDAPDRDPRVMVLKGSNATDAPDFNSHDWELIAEIKVADQWNERFQDRTFIFDNDKSYTHYYWAVTEVQGNCCMQVAEVQFLGPQVSAPVAGINQTVQDVGEFRGPPSGGWDSMEFYPMKEALGGGLAAVKIGGETTVRLTKVGGNMDANYMAFVKSDIQEYPPLLVGFGPVGKRIRVDDVGARFVKRELDFEDLSMTINGETVEVSTSTEEGIITVTAQGDPNGGEAVINWNGRSHSWSYHIPDFYRDGADPYSTSKGGITAREYHGLGGVLVGDLVRAEKFPGRADRTETAGYFEWPQSGNIEEWPPGNVHDDYGVQLVGFVHPPVTAKYRFYIAADDQAHLWLSTDENPVNRQLIAVEPQWNGVRDFTTSDRRWVVDEGTDDERLVNASKYIELEAGKAYFIEALMKEGGGGDNLAVAARIEGDDEIENGDEPIPGEFLSPWWTLPYVSGFDGTLEGFSISLTYMEQNPVDLGSVNVRLNGNNVGRSVTSENGVVTVGYSPDKKLSAGRYGIDFEYIDSKGNHNHRWFEFEVPEYRAIDPRSIASESIKGESGFIAYISQISHGQGVGELHGNRWQNAERQIRGEYIDPDTGAPYINEADVDSFEEWSFYPEILETVNLNQDTEGAADSMQIAEVELLQDQEDITSPEDEVVPTSDNSPGNEQGYHAIDDDINTKYLNFDKEDSGLTIATGDRVVTGLALTSANDAPERDPTTFILSGSNDDGETFVEIASGDVPAFGSRFERQVVSFDNETSYSVYKLVFPTVLDKRSEGNFYDDQPIPGIPGWGDSTDGIAAEFVTLLELDRGFYTLGVNSDDGFSASIAANFADLASQQIGLFNGGRSASDSLFSIWVDEAGLYPFRVSWWEGGGEANIEIFSIVNGQKILINDPDHDDAIKAYTIQGAVVDESTTERATTGRPAVISIYPRPGDKMVRDHFVEVKIKNGETTVDQDSVVMALDGESVDPSVSLDGDIVTISYVSSDGFKDGTHSVSLTVNESSGAERGGNWDFYVPSIYNLGRQVPTEAQGGLTVHEYHGIGGTDLGEMLSNAWNFPDEPDVNTIAGYFEWPQTGNIDSPPPGDVRNDYGVQMIGFLHPTETGDYQFAIAADDNA